jgi:phosphoribosylformimino-5-aminoimidazole carboxamide ribotide isomerase
LITNFESDQDAAWFALYYQSFDCTGGHVIQLGQNCEEAALAALGAWPNGLQIGGGVNATNAQRWIDAGASHVIVTSWLFENNDLSMERVRELARVVGREKVVIDLSCRRVAQGWSVATNRWQTITNTSVDATLFNQLADYCDEFLVHAADVEGQCKGMDLELIELLGQASPLPVTYAGGASKLEDLEVVQKHSNGRVDLTIGSALDLFGGAVAFEKCVQWNRRS